MTDKRDVVLAKRAREQQFERTTVAYNGKIVSRAGSVRVPGIPNHVWVLPTDESEPEAVYNRTVKDTHPGLPVVVGYAPKSKTLEILQTDVEHLAGYAETGGLDVPNHGDTHRSPKAGGDDPVWVDRDLIIDQLYLSPGSGLAVNLSPCEYDSGASRGYFPGKLNHSIAAAKPAAGLALFVLVYLDTADNTIKTVTGSTVPDLDWLLPTKPDTPAGGITAGYVRLDGSQTSISRADIDQGRRMVMPAGLLLSTGAISGASAVPQLFTSGIDVNGTADAVILDADGDTTISAPVDDEIDIEVGGSDVAEFKAGGLYLAAGTDAYPAGDAAGIFSRAVNFGRTPAEHWASGADQLTWTGWAAYTGFATPATITRVNSQLSITHSGTTRAFYYRPYINAQTSILTRCGTALANESGVMVDDGVGNADGNGANNFIRFFIEWPVATANANLALAVRTGGGAVTKTTYMSFPPQDLYGIVLLYGVGTRWTNWTALARLIGTAGQIISVVQTGAQTWTPARHGLYGYISTNTRQCIYDWFEEV